MKRLRLVFVLLSALLWVPLSCLVVFALRTVEQEEAGRYKAVADRIFDEMERELTALLRREEERSSAAYVFDVPGRAAAVAAAADNPFVLGYFERDARGALQHTPFRGGGAEIEGLLGAAALM